MPSHNVLLVEDVHQVRDLYYLHLKEKHNFTITTAASFNEALDHSDQHFDLAVLDLVIPLKSGQLPTNEEVLKTYGARLGIELKRLQPDLKIVFFSEHSDRGAWLIPLIGKLINPEHRGIAFISKTTSIDVLDDAITRVLNNEIVGNSQVSMVLSQVDAILISYTKTQQNEIYRIIDNLFDAKNKRSVEAVCLYAKSKSPKEVSKKLNIHVDTVNGYIAGLRGTMAVPLFMKYVEPACNVFEIFQTAGLRKHDIREWK